MAGEYVFELERVSKFAGKTAILDDVTLAFFFGAKIGVIGPNGSGKSSLLRVLAGVDTDISGTARRAARARIGYLEQEPRLDPEHTVTQAVEEGAAAARAVLDRYDELCAKLGEALSPEETAAVNEEYDRIQHLIDTHDLWNLDGQIQQAMDALRLPPDDAKIRVLSGGERRRVALCRLLLSNPDVLLLDEPTNHLDAESVDWLEQYLHKFPGTIICVTHDRYFLSRVTEWILELDQGRALPFKGNYESWLEQRQAMLAREQKQQASRRRLLERELEWVRMSAGARHSRNLARLKRYEELAAQVVDTREDEVQIQIPAGPRLGDLVVRAEDLSFGYGERLLMEHVNFDLPRGGIVGVIGGNGAGKTTLFRMILGQERPLSGTLRVGESVIPAHVDQMRDALNPEATVYEEICLGRDTVDLGGRAMNGRAYCSRFNLRGADQQKKVGVLSGGERNRVQLAKLLKSGGNLLLLDEPTNDLDIATLRSLEEALTGFGGCAVVISHDRWFLDRVATHILSFEGDSEVVWFEGNYAEYREARRDRLGDAADRPHRMRFRPLRTR